MQNRPVWLLPVLATLLALVAVFALLVVRGAGGDGRSLPATRTSGEAQVGGDFTLVDETGATVTNADFEGQAMLIYFGFTYCPDICPFSLQILADALSRLNEEQRAQFQPLLITVDPERDTPEVLAEYVDSPAFPDRLKGLTGTPEQVSQAARAYRVYYARAEDPQTTGGYTMDHTSLIYLMDREGRFVDVFPHTADPETIASRLRQFLANDARAS
ncbi:electron transporter SenC [Marinicauda pacifica]|jgi:protein SCO1/2|uniref:SCO family protein n=1 Tax=Marinicauda pacifica TaxID=1133559 RepID=A0A4S2HBE3_9PROT|nr:MULTISPECIES: SCO family protein [Marinicauda]TGY93244.1 SCO family protein [Marinicauda pacifica]GGE44066.1 electron transporter SenC [Marinicauda pacifica]